LTRHGRGYRILWIPGKHRDQHPAELDLLRRRVADTGVTYHVVIPMSPGTQALFADEVMPSVT
jgi:hypothetical protein